MEYARPKPVLANDHRFHQKWRWNEKGRFVVCVSAHRWRFSISSENEPDKSSRIYRSRSISAISWPYRLMHSKMFVAPSARACEKHTVILPFKFLSSFAMTGSGRIHLYIHYCIYYSFVYFVCSIKGRKQRFVPACLLENAAVRAGRGGSRDISRCIGLASLPAGSACVALISNRETGLVAAC